MENPIIQSMLSHRSVRKFTQQIPGDDVLEAVVRAGQQAPFASQLYSILLRRNRKCPFGAAWWFTICVDIHKMELFMEKRGWKVVSSDLALLLFGIQDAAYAAENMVIAAEGLGLGTCFIGSAPYQSKRTRKEFKLPLHVFPLVDLVMGYPAEDFPPRPRYPLEFTLFENSYPDLSGEKLERAMQAMDDGYLAQGYYMKQKAKLPLEGGRIETFTYDDYSWTEHISRKWGQWWADPRELLDQLEACGFNIGGNVNRET